MVDKKTFITGLDKFDYTFRLIVMNNCNHCHMARKALEAHISTDRILVLEADSDRGKMIVEKYNIEAVPTLVVIRCGKVTKLVGLKTLKEYQDAMKSYPCPEPCK